MAFIIKPVTLTLLVVALCPMANALRYAGFASSDSCSGPNFFCIDTGGVCCSLPDGFGFSVEFFDLPNSRQGQGYSGDACNDFLFSVFGPGGKCWNGGGLRATHMNHFASAGRAVRSVEVVADNTTCVGPQGFSYKDGVGVERSIRVPLGEADSIIQLYTKNDFAGLANFPVY